MIGRAVLSLVTGEPHHIKTLSLWQTRVSDFGHRYPIDGFVGSRSDVPQVALSVEGPPEQVGVRWRVMDSSFKQTRVFKFRTGRTAQEICWRKDREI
jgi:hypothetical protein